MNQAQAHILEVSGARLYFEAEGNDPVLVLIPGANGDNQIFKPLRAFLKEHYIVVTYDRRGFSNSKLTGPQDYDRRLETDADDVQSLIAHLTSEPAFVLGSSSGAIVALKVLCRHPSSVRTVVAHEPPLVKPLPDSDKWVEFFQSVYDTQRESGLSAAMEKFTSILSNRSDVALMSGDSPMKRSETAMKNGKYWFEHELRQYSGSNLDMNAIKQNADKLILAVGLASQNDFPSFPAKELSKILNKPIFDVPGGHLGYVVEP
jgi:pimeloyl-ACP methyl ester carboxylesterase